MDEKNVNATVGPFTLLHFFFRRGGFFLSDNIVQMAFD